MTIPRPAEVNYYLTGIVDMARGDRGGLAYLDKSARGFWRSFWALFYALPAYIYSWFHDRTVFQANNPETVVGADYIVRSALADAAGLVVSLVVVALLARPLGMTDRFVQWVIASNWLSLPLAYIAGVVLMVTTVLGTHGSLTFLLMIVLIVGVLVVSYRVYKIALEGDGMLAVGIIIITHLVGLFVMLAIV